MSDEALSYIPAPTMSFLGGPYDGFVAEPDVEPGIHVEFPDWLRPEDAESIYIRLCPCHIPAWIVAPPHMDVFDSVYVWHPYLGDGDVEVEPVPEPEYL